MLTRSDIIKSISPESLSKMLKVNTVESEFYELLSEEVRSFQGNSEPRVAEVKNHFQERILPLFRRDVLREECKPFFRNYERKIVAAYGLCKTREFIVEELAKKLVFEHLGRPLEDYFFKDEAEPNERCQYSDDLLREAGQKIVKNDLIFDCLIGQLAQICGLFFFGFELLTKLFLVSSCLKFATRIIQRQVIQHGDVWKTLRMLGGGQTQTDCQICRLRDSCNFHYPFVDFAGLYAFIIKIRMLTDYTEVLHRDRRFIVFIIAEYPMLMFPLFISLDTQITQIHEGFMFYPSTLRGNFELLDDILSKRSEA